MPVTVEHNPHCTKHEDVSVSLGRLPLNFDGIGNVSCVPMLGCEVSSLREASGKLPPMVVIGLVSSRDQPIGVYFAMHDAAHARAVAAGLMAAAAALDAGKGVQ